VPAFPLPVVHRAHRLRPGEAWTVAVALDRRDDQATAGARRKDYVVDAAFVVVPMPDDQGEMVGDLEDRPRAGLADPLVETLHVVEDAEIGPEVSAGRAVHQAHPEARLVE
jgi:hypothetical protein